MERGMNKAVIVTRKTRLQDMIYKYNTVEQAKFYIEHSGGDFSDYLKEHNTYTAAVELVRTATEKYARVQLADRAYIPNMVLGERDTVITVGQDGLAANVMKYLKGQPLVAINPDPERYDGVLLPFLPSDTESILKKVVKGSFNTKEITMARAKTNDGQTLYGVNDLFVGQKTHVSARYDLVFKGKRENQSSSGIIVSTGLGSTGWYKSIMAQTAQIGRVYGVEGIKYQSIDWSEDKLVFTVREPYPSRFTGAELVQGSLGRGDSLKIVSKMPENGVLFSDGMEEDFISFNAGTEITVDIAEKKGKLVVE